MTDWFTAAEITRLPGMPTSEYGVRLRAQREGWTSRPRARGKGLEYSFDSLPAQTQAALLLRRKAAEAPTAEVAAERSRRIRVVPPSQDELNSRGEVYARLPASYRETAEARVKALDAVDRLVREGRSVMEARAAVARELSAAGERASPNTLWRWARDVDLVPRPYWKYYLTPRWTGRTARAECSTEAWDWFKADFLRLEAPSAKACYRRLQAVARQNGWKVPSFATLCRRLTREVARPVIVYTREGEDALDRMYPAQERDRSMLGALDWVNADGHRFDVFARTPADTICRPVMVAWQCVYSGKILAWAYGETESAELVRLAFANLVRKWGIPKHVLFDNGRGFAAKWLTGGVANRFRFKVKPEDPVGIIVGLGCEVHWATPYRGQAKPIERAFKDLCEDGAKHPAFAGAYTGNHPQAKPENYASKAVPWDEFVRVMDGVIHAHNARVGRTSKVAAGRSFDQVFEESYRATPVRRATEEQLRTLLLASEAVTANARDGSVTLAGNRYWTEALARYAGQKVVLRVDPSRLHDPVHVYTLAGEYIAQAECTAAVGFADQAAAGEHQRAKRQWKRAMKQQAEAARRMTVARLADQLADAAPGETPIAPPRVVEAVFRKPRRAPTPLPSGELTEEEIRQKEFLAQVAATQQRRW